MKHIFDTWIDKFKDEVWSLQLNIAMDGVYLYSLQNPNHYVWSVIVINNNTTPWLSMKNEHLMMALIVSSRKKVKRMDVYL